MSMTNLEKRQIIDKNGNLTTRWVKHYGAPSRYAYDPPAPKSEATAPLPRGAVKEMKEIKSRLTARMNAEFKEATRSNPWGWTENKHDECLTAINTAFSDREYEKLRVFDKHMSINFKSEYLGKLVDHFQSQGYRDLADSFSKEFLDGFTKVSDKVRRQTIGGFPETIRDLSLDERDELVNYAGELMYTNPGSEEKVYSLIVDHGVLDHSRLAAALEESDRINTPFMGGIL